MADSSATAAGFTALLANLRERRQNPSPRNPNVSTENNLADNIERQLQEDGHRKWGYAIYRCTYKSNEEWDACLAKISNYTNECLSFYGGLDMLSSMDTIVVEDQDHLEGASPHAVRDRFRQWVLTAPQKEQGTTSTGESARYNFCVMINQEALESILQPRPQDQVFDQGWAILIRSPYDDDNFWMRIAARGLMVEWYHDLRNLNAWIRLRRDFPDIIQP